MPHLCTVRDVRSVLVKNSHIWIGCLHMPSMQSKQGSVNTRDVIYFNSASIASMTGCVRILFTMRIDFGGCSGLHLCFPGCQRFEVQMTGLTVIRTLVLRLGCSGQLRDLWRRTRRVFWLYTFEGRQASVEGRTWAESAT